MKHLLAVNRETLAKQAALLRLTAASLAAGFKTGSFRSLFRGQGIEFSGVREYLRGDDVRAIDWNVTARMGKPYVKLFEEERELQIFIVVDRSRSMFSGTGSKTRYRTAAEAASLVAMAAEINASGIGAVFFDGDIQFSCAPESGRKRTMLLLARLDEVDEYGVSGSALKSALTGAGNGDDQAASNAAPLEVRPVTTAPPAKEDIALVVDSDVTAAEIENVIRKAAGDLLESAVLFDVYTGDQVGEGKKSLAFALRFRSDHTLSAEETAAVRKRIVKAARKSGAELRA